MSKQPVGSTKMYSPSVSRDDDISYEPSLIPYLTSQHTRILMEIKAVETHARNGDYSNTRKALESFGTELQVHLLQENFRLYPYLAQSVIDVRDDNKRQIAAEMFKEMGVIGRTVVEFLNHYGEYPLGEENLETFCTELDRICNALRERMFREETTLFKLYVPREE
jgi:regulator of sigma D